MSKNYDLFSSSDMRRLSKDLNKAVEEEAREAAKKMKYDIECPYCNAAISVPPGKSTCPRCHKEINLTLDFNF